MKRIAFNPHSWPEQPNLANQIQSIAPKHSILDLSHPPTEAQLAECEILFGNVAPQIINKMTAIKWVHAQTAGADAYLNSKVILANDVILTSSTGAFGISIGEYMLTTTLMLLRNMSGYMTQQTERVWKWRDNATNLYGKSITIVGMGDIGSRYAYLCHAMGAKVTGVVRTKRASKPDYVQNLFTTDNLKQALEDADIIALAMPGTNETAGILSRKILEGLKKGAFILNVGRGSAIDQDALAELLGTGHLSGAALDVTNPEPLPAENPLWSAPNTIITPHVSHGGRENIGGFVCDKFLRYLQDYVNGKPFERVVDRIAGY